MARSRTRRQRTSCGWSSTYRATAWPPSHANAQYGGGYQQYGGVGGPQPPKNKGPVIAIVSIVVLLLAGLGITGFVAPGFFLGVLLGATGRWWLSGLGVVLLAAYSAGI